MPNPLEFTQAEICTWNPRIQALSKLADAHFATFNAMEAAKGRRERDRLFKALATIWHAAEYLRSNPT